jgi:pimeloyl-ACP methyl ester carboxylesterase
MELFGTGSASAVLVAANGAPGAQASGNGSAAAVRRQVAAPASAGLSRITLEEIGEYDVERMNHILTTELAEFSNFEISYEPARYGVKLYRVTYPSVIPEQNNRPTVASGLIAIPQEGGANLPGKLPVVSYQHGSVFGQNEVPSSLENSTETRLMVAVFGGQGYMVIGADYFGRGLSSEPNSYIVKASTQQACLDMLFAAQTAGEELGVEMGQLFLSGWSQGGYSAFTFLNRLENLGVAVTAIAVASGPIDLYATVNRWANAWEPIDAVYIPPLQSNMILAFEAYYELPGLANSAIRPEYQETARLLFRGEITYEEAAPLLPTRYPDLLQDDFKAAIAAGENRFSRILQDSHAYRWRMATPARVYYGGSDEVTPIFIGTLPVGYQQVMGGAEVTAVDAGQNADHRGVFLYGMKDQKQWFDELLETE